MQQMLGQAVTEQCAVGQTGKGVVVQQSGHLQQLLHPLLDGALQIMQLARGVLGQLPLPAQGIGHLADFQTVEGLFQDQQLVAELDVLGQFVPGVVRERRAQGNLQVRVGLPQCLDGFQAIPARGHAHVGECHGVGTALRTCAGDQLQRVFTPVGGIEFELQASPGG
ncbi:hypothetical protein D3C85_1159000 [compost metagenome]